MQIPEGFQPLIEKIIAKDKNLNAIAMAAAITGNKTALNCVTTIAEASVLPHIINPDASLLFYPPPTDENFEGNFCYGKGNGFRPRDNVNNLTKGLVHLGTIGCGKTNTALYYAKQLHADGKNPLHLGFKQSLRHYKEIPILTLITGTAANVCWQIFDYPPPGVEAIHWDLLTSRVFGGTTYLLEAGQSVLLQVITGLRKEDKHVNPTTILEKLRTIKTQSFREKEWKASLINRFTEFNIVCGRMFSKQVRFPLEEILKLLCVELELDRAGSFAPFIATMAIAYLYEYRKANNIRGDELITPIMCDELHSLVNTTMARYFPKEELPLLDYMRKGREFCNGLILFTNEIGSIPLAIKSQANIKAIMRTVDFNEIKEMGSSMNLTQEQMELCLDLPVGWAIMKIPEISPFLTYFPLIDIKKDMTDERVNERNKNLLSGTGFESILWIPEDMPISFGSGTQEEKSEDKKLSIEERCLLMDVYNHEFTPTAERFSSLGLSAGKGSRLTNRLIVKNLLRKQEISLGGRGSSIILLELTTETYELLGLSPKKYGRGSNLEHYFWQVRVRDYFKSL